MTLIAKLKFANVKRNNEPASPQERMRKRMIESLGEQLELALALNEGRILTKTKRIFEKDETGQQRAVDKERKIRPWFWHDTSSKWYIELRYGNVLLAIDGKQTAIEVGAKEKLVSVIETLIKAAEAGELDNALTAAVTKRVRLAKRAA